MTTAKRVSSSVREQLSGAAQYDEERIPFDDVMRTLLKAKPQHRPAAKPTKAKAKKK
jgi:hypothetical protein